MQISSNDAYASEYWETEHERAQHSEARPAGMEHAQKDRSHREQSNARHAWKKHPQMPNSLSSAAWTKGNQYVRESLDTNKRTEFSPNEC